MNYRIIKYFRFHFPKSIISWLFPSKEEILITISGVTYLCRGRYASVYDIDEDIEEVFIRSFVFTNNRFYIVNSINHDEVQSININNKDIVKTIHFPDTVTRIASSSFRDFSEIVTLWLPDSLNIIEENAFNGCKSLKNIRFPRKIKKIGYNAFANCINLSKVNFSQQVDKIGHGIFDNCPLIADPIFSRDYFVKLNQSFIGVYQVPKGIKTICSNAFIDCDGLTAISIPNSVTRFLDRAFFGCRNINHSIIMNGELFYERKNIDDTYQFPEGVSTIGSCAFWKCDKLTKISIPNSVKHIKHSAFCDCVNLKDVHLHDDVDFEVTANEDELIGSTFEECPSIQSPIYNKSYFVHLPRNFEGKYVVPKGIKAIACKAFENCNELESVIIPEGVSTIGCYAFEETKSLYSINLPQTIEFIYDGAFENSGIEKIELPNKIKILPPYIFAFCKSLYSVVLPNHLEIIGKGAFCHVDTPYAKYTHSKQYFESIKIPDSVRIIDTYAFHSCNYLKTINMSKSLEYLGKKALSNTKITELSFSSNLKKIGSNSFDQMKELKHILVPNNRIYDLIAKEYSCHDNILLYNEDEMDFVK